MKKMLLVASLGLVSLSVQASEDWHTMPDTESAKDLAQSDFFYDTDKITLYDIEVAVRKFPDFLEWKQPRSGGTVTHYISGLHTNFAVLYTLLSFSPDLTIVDNEGHTARQVCKDVRLKDVFDEYERKPWVNPKTVEIRAVHAADKRAKDRLSKKNDSILPAFINRYTVGGLGAVALLGIVYNYCCSGSKEAKK